MYVDKKQAKAVLYTYDIYPRYQEKLFPVKLHGLHPAKMYKVEEINLMPGRKSDLKVQGRVFSGDYLMKVGLNAFTPGQAKSRMIEITEQ